MLVGGDSFVLLVFHEYHEGRHEDIFERHWQGDCLGLILAAKVQPRFLFDASRIQWLRSCYDLSSRYCNRQRYSFTFNF